MSQAARSGGRQAGAVGVVATGRRPADPSVAPWPAASRDNNAAFNAEGAGTPDRLLSCMAAFYDSETQARQALLQLRQAGGLQPSQSLLLSPNDTGRLRFARLSRRWAHGRDADSARKIAVPWVAGIAGALLAILAALALLWVGARESDFWPMATLLVLLFVGGLLGASLLALFVQPRQPHRFDDKVRAQLALGCWALVTHRVPWPQQAGVVKLLRSTSLGWCAEAPHIHRL